VLEGTKGWQCLTISALTVTSDESGALMVSSAMVHCSSGGGDEEVGLARRGGSVRP
jgi:hypothetical protein